MRRHPHAFGLAGSLLISLLLPATRASAQLRPLDPLDWGVLGPEGNTVVVGTAFYSGQRASLAGTEGLLLELGAFRASWGFGRVAVELAGTALRVFEERSTFADPIGGVLPAADDRRRDVGDYRVSTILGLTRPGSRLGAALRFGVRLPTTDDVQGLERDQTDFYSLLVGRAADGPWELVAEAGLGINGTRDLQVGQVDPMLFALSGSWDFGSLAALVEATGQHDTRRGADCRGTEDLGEARLGLRLGEARWLSVTAVRGWTPSSPDFGVAVMLGTRF